MERLSLTPFGRQPASLDQLNAISEQQTRSAPVSKWDVLRDLTTAREVFGLSHRTLSVLQALLSFHPKPDLEGTGPIVVFPSNKTLSARSHGMPESTLRRHLAALVRSGFILRHDSPNGKRYARKGPSGIIAIAFGFDLAPLLHRAKEVSCAAQRIEIENAELSALRERCVVQLRDAIKISALVENTDSDVKARMERVHKGLRRKPTRAGLEAVQRDLQSVLKTLKEAYETSKLIANDTQIERHIEVQKPNHFEIRKRRQKANNHLQIDDVRKAIPEFADLKDWIAIIRHASFLRTIIGIDNALWHQSCEELGACEASVVVGYVLSRIEEIENPGGYIRSLYMAGQSNDLCVPSLVFSLLNKQQKSAA